jgi:hypothetical protein
VGLGGLLPSGQSVHSGWLQGSHTKPCLSIILNHNNPCLKDEIQKAFISIQIGARDILSIWIKAWEDG